jgi:hypothetical protein
MGVMPSYGLVWQYSTLGSCAWLPFDETDMRISHGRW